MKAFKKFISLCLAAATAVSAMSITALADDNDVVYSYINENGTEVNVTQTDLDAGSWNKDALGDTAPFVYEDFPMEIEKFVDDYANLSLRLTYMKTLSENDSATLSIIDWFAYEEVASYNDVTNGFYTASLEIGKDYALKLTETIDGVTTEYYKMVSTMNAAADMPDYMADSDTTAENTVLIGNIEDLKASETIDEDGEVVIDGTMKRYEKVKACDFAEYKDTLDNDSIYRIYTIDDSEKRYSGFISTYSDGASLGIYNPEIRVITWEAYNAPSAATLPSSNYITAARIKAASKIMMDNFRDYGYHLTDSGSFYFRVFAFQMPTCDMDRDNFIFSAHSQSSVNLEIWTATSLTATPVFRDKKPTASKNINHTILASHYASNAGDYIFFVLYDKVESSCYGMAGIEPQNLENYPSTDVSGSAYNAYVGGGAASMNRTVYTLYSGRDADTFYVNYAGSSSVKYTTQISTLLREGETSGNDVDCAKTLEVSYYNSNLSYFCTTHDPSDVITVAIDSFKNYNFSVSPTNRAFLTIYGDESATDSSNYTLSYRIKT